MKTATIRLVLSVGAAAIIVAHGMASAQAGAVPQSGGKSQVTFTKDIAPILQRSCQACHRPDNMAPMSLLSYEEVRPWARSIKQKVMLREMPPWHIDPYVGIQQFKNDPSLSKREIAAIVEWVDSGAPKGNAADMPPPREFPAEGAWRIGGGEPEFIVSSPKHMVEAEAADWWGDYFVPTGLTEDRYIKAIQTKAGNLEVVHHMITSAVEDPDEPPENSEYLSEYAVGKNADVYPEDTGKLLKAGAQIKFAFHYHSIGEDATDITELGFVFYPKGEVPEHVLNVKGLGRVGGGSAGEVHMLDIPPGQVVRHDGYTRLKNAAKITGFQPHMHLLGRRQCLEFIYPNGTTEVANCANFNFNWHIVYNYQDAASPIVPAGTTVHVISYHDNSAGNRGANDPKNWAGSGHRTVDEMAFAHMSWYDLTEEEYNQEIAARADQE